MPFIGIADPETVTRLRDVVQRYCRDNDITDEQEREQVAFRVVALFNGGMTDRDDLLKTLTVRGHRSIG